MSNSTYETEKLYSKFRRALLLIADNYHMMYKEDMTPIDLHNVNAIIDSGIGEWKMDELNGVCFPNSHHYCFGR